MLKPTLIIIFVTSVLNACDNPSFSAKGNKTNTNVGDERGASEEAVGEIVPTSGDDVDLENAEIVKPTCRITAPSDSIKISESVELTIEVLTGSATSIKLDGQSIKASGDKISVTPSTSTVYEGQIEGPGGNATCSYNVNVIQCPDYAALTAEWGAVASPHTFIKNNGDTIELGDAIRRTAATCGIDIPGSGPFVMSNDAVGSGLQWTNVGSFHGTANKICDILGFKTFVSATCHDSERSGSYPAGKCNWNSPDNNSSTYWDGASWIVWPAPPKYTSTWISSITCTDKR